MVPVVSIEYKEPHKFPLAQIIAGLNGEIRPGDEIINKEGDDFDFLSKTLVAAVISYPTILIHACKGGPARLRL
jgi:hypothetical protein